MEARLTPYRLRTLRIDEMLGRPTVFHVTHWKAGSQWVKALLAGVAWRRIVPAAPQMEQVLRDPILPGAVYPTVYLTRERFERLDLPENRRVFVVIRDLRDTLVSYYFSMKYSHPPITSFVAQERRELLQRDMESGLLHLMDNQLRACARIQRSWIDSGHEVFRYEDLLRDTLGVFQRIVAVCDLKVSAPRLRAVVDQNRFERLSGGRRPGQEDVRSHFRKGIVGDWRNYLSPRMQNALKERFGDALIRAGYETSLDW